VLVASHDLRTAKAFILNPAVEQGHVMSGKRIQQAVGVLLVKMFWTSKTSCAARAGH